MPPEDERASSSAGTLQEGQHRPGLRRVRSQDLFQDARDLIIEHNEEEYRLRITRLGKLILTK
jgi:hemin uptake protein HemP